jgi:hypothetical protein
MHVSLDDYLHFVLLWLKQRTGVHLGELVIYPAMVRHCLCCHGSANYAHETNGLCAKCLVDQKCTICHEPFTPSLDSVATFCPTCWKRLETTWTTVFENEDPVRAEIAVRTAVTKAQPPLIGCPHLG